jgi:hypothetical protein
MLNRCRTLTAAALAVLLVLAPLESMAAERTPNTTPPNGLPGGVDIMGGWDGTTWRALGTDPNGILRTTEEYPITTQRAPLPVATLVPVHSGHKALSNGAALSPYGYRVLTVTRTAGRLLG